VASIVGWVMTDELEVPVTTIKTTTARPAGAFAALVDERQILLTSFRRDGTPVSTPVHLVVEGDRILVRTFDPSGKLKRIRANADVEVAPCTLRGRVTGWTLRATAQILQGDESAEAAAALAARYPFLHGRLIPWYHRRKGLVTTQLELTPR
jgi:hypothetical protein